MHMYVYIDYPDYTDSVFMRATVEAVFISVLNKSSDSKMSKGLLRRQ